MNRKLGIILKCDRVSFLNGTPEAVSRMTCDLAVGSYLKDVANFSLFWLGPVSKGPVALGGKNFVSSAEFQEKFWFNKFLLQNFS